MGPPRKLVRDGGVTWVTEEQWREQRRQHGGLLISGLSSDAKPGVSLVSTTTHQRNLRLSGDSRLRGRANTFPIKLSIVRLATHHLHRLKPTPETNWRSLPWRRTLRDTNSYNGLHKHFEAFAASHACSRRNAAWGSHGACSMLFRLTARGLP